MKWSFMLGIIDYIIAFITILQMSYNYHYTPYSAHMSPENTHKLMGFYMEVLILGVML